MKKLYILIVLLFLGIIPVLSLLHPGLPITHDGQDHVARIANFYQNLTEGNLIPRWAPNLNWGYGHPILEFLYPLPSYIASSFHFIGVSLVDSTKIVFALGMILSLFSMYLWLSQFTSKSASLFGAVLYTYAPYRFVETYVRGDIGENLAFAFIPLVLFFVYKIYKTKDYRFTVFGGISLALLILSHNAISLIFVPFIFFYCAYLIFLSKKRKLLITSFSTLIVMAFALPAFFWIPALLEGKYTLRNIVTQGVYVDRFVSFTSLIYSQWSYGQISSQLGLFQWVALILSPLTIFQFRKNREKYFLIIASLFYAILGIFLMLSLSNFIWAKIMLLQNFQFPWRFLAIEVFVTSILGALLFELLAKKINHRIILIGSVMLILLISSFYWFPKGYQYKPESFYSGIYNGTTDTGESAPIWSVRFMEKGPKAHLQVLDGQAQIQEIKRMSTEHVYNVIVRKNTLFAENTLYFPGWEIKANKTPVKVQFQNENYRGIMTFSLSKGNYIIDAKYSETKLRFISDILSFISAAMIIIFLGFKFVKQRLS